MRLLLSADDMTEGLDALVAADPRLGPLREACGTVEIRHRPPGFEGVARIVVAQMVSVASATAIWNRLDQTLGTVTAETVLAADDATLRAAGLSGAKSRTLRAVAAAVRDGLDLQALAEAPADDAVAALVALPGIGRWTAEIFLLFCARHADVFPAGDLALQVAAMEGLGLPARPTEKEMRQMAEAWSPWRGVAAKLFWAYHKVCREGRAAVPV
ncbi:DNA-3-methyladenine glycosylase family protein [Chthonobacter rhizosphaerae]|uniref:DNA-3-methyladenine glycosylase family protein n=1 Tax=Chthonobacter rhizosphaerae TaxID=2735553 RepID=UPI0015EE435D|nr:DNA-3-methyladenine glycosylase 2 family protein [Chthonobacter rhizosphaerae]